MAEFQKALKEKWRRLTTEELQVIFDESLTALGSIGDRPVRRCV